MDKIGGGGRETFPVPHKGNGSKVLSLTYFCSIALQFYF
jgi:hypothetical protein